MGRKVVVVPYHSEWPEHFEAEASALKRVFGAQLLGVYHFGSTAIPGLSAKPIIDILITVASIETVDDLTAHIEALGYTAVGEYGIPGRRFFYKGSFEDRTHHLHVYEVENSNIVRHLAFRDYMRSHPIPARQYAALKEQLAREFPEDMDGYIIGKNDFVKTQERLALEWWQAEGLLVEQFPDRFGKTEAIHGGRRRKIRGD